MPTATGGYEYFDRTGFKIESLDLSVPRLTANYGAGYQANALGNGSPYPLRAWSLICTALPDDPLWMIFRPDGESQTRLVYFCEFWNRHQVWIDADSGTVVSVNEPFIIQDPVNLKRYYASFLADSISYATLTTKVFTVGIKLVQRRILGASMFPDGSLNETAPVDPDGDNPDHI